MKGLMKRELLLILAAAWIVLMIPAMFAAMGVQTPWLEEVHAGGDVDLDSVTIHHANTDKTVYNGENIYATASDLASAYGMSESEFTGMVSSGKVSVSFSVSFYNKDDTEMQHEISSQKLKTSFSGGAYQASISTSYYPHDGVFAAVQLFTLGEDSHYSNNTPKYKIVDRFESKTKINPTYYQSCTFDKATLVFSLSQVGQYKEYDSSGTYSANVTMFRYFNSKGKEIAHFKKSGSTNLEMKVPIKYGKNKITVGLYSIVNGKEYFAASYILNLTSAKVGKNTVHATKISKNKAIVRWSGVSGAKGYYVYQGSKKIKTLKKSARRLVVSRKNAGKSKFKVIPYIRSGGIKKGTSNKAKPKANVFSRSVSSNYKIYDYGKGQLVLKKIKGSGKKYTITCYAVNNRIFKLEKYKKITIKVWADGKLLFKKTIRNKKVNVKENSLKRITFKTKGKIGDLKNGSVTYSISYKPVFEYGWGPM